MNILPSVNCSSSACVRDALVRINGIFKACPLPSSRFVHLDVADGRYSSHVTWNCPSELPELKKIVSDASFELHLMIEAPQDYLVTWFDALADRVIIHPDAVSVSGVEFLRSLLGKWGERIALALQPQSSLDVLRPYIDLVSRVQVLGVHPGRVNQEQDSDLFLRIAALRKLLPRVSLEVDGGVTEAEIGELKRLGVDDVVVYSALFLSSDPLGAYERLLTLASS